MTLQTKVLSKSEQCDDDRNKNANVCKKPSSDTGSLLAQSWSNPADIGHTSHPWHRACSDILHGYHTEDPPNLPTHTITKD